MVNGPRKCPHPLRQKPVELDRMAEIAKIQSTESFNKIEGIVTTSARMKQLFEEKTTPRNRDEDDWQMFFLGIAFGAIPAFLTSVGRDGIYAVKGVLNKI